MFSQSLGGEQWLPREPRPRNTSVPSCRSSQVGGLCRETLLVSSRLGGGAATGHLMTEHREGERETASKHAIRLGVLCPEDPVQSLLDIRKTPQEGSAHGWPVRRQARSLPSAVTRRQSA